jgi:hypothetical protein
MLFATLYDDEMMVTPSAYAMAQARMKPVTREIAVEIDIVAVDRATDGVAIGASLHVRTVIV